MRGIQNQNTLHRRGANEKGFLCFAVKIYQILYVAKRLAVSSE